ncbi:SidA/IucD/PvdA family monooxygenase [Streptomyces sp. PCS3-D2]|uniref:lysine N(6)-hydroxylase/L-ornithine N(5)-oxygenase family protein n=1 Tax=Streptomyces sp. PCS3-D2 TaxID=1460244 RepID=UPI000452FF97|nr:SidA/IucD/PvdA family monooxygenase [Streptomyces sp. PCS3-D2]WKV73026.1 SidA/IucD/PvdA family monooxygenase [Streptomyces sp. PCS3-D2]
MAHRNVELLAVGAGPANLALAIAVEELAPELAGDTLLIERERDIVWQRGMLLPDALSQVSFLKDLVTLRNPTSRFSFVNFLHAQERLDAFVNLASFVPYRSEISEYLQWVADELDTVKVEYGRECTSVEPVTGTDGEVSGWVVTLADGDTIGCRYLVIGAGRDAHVPEVFAGLPADRVIHSTQYSQRIGEVRKDLPHRVAVVGGAQSAAELFGAALRDLPECKPTMIMRSIGLNGYESSKFTNELYYSSFIDEFYESSPEARQQLLAEMYRSNYGGLAPATLDGLYRQFYQDRRSGEERLGMQPMTDVAAARMDGEEVVLTLVDRKSGTEREMRTDLVLLGTGFVRAMPWAVKALAAAIGLDEINVSRNYRLDLGRPATAAVYLQGVNEATHGIADSLLSVLAGRSAEITQDILAHRRSRSAEFTAEARELALAGAV